MRAPRLTPLALLVALAAHAEPTENWLDEEAEARNHEARRQWMRELHRAAPGVDTDALERLNGLAQIERRNALRRAPPGPTPTAAWVERGSANQAGRMHAGHLNPSGDTLYGGTSLGGVWRGSPDGSDWEPVGDNLYGGAHWLEVLDDGSGGEILFVCTDGGLVHRSLDGGDTWEEPTGLGAISSVRRLLKLHDGSEALFLLSAGDKGVRLQRSLDLGASFENVADLSGYYGDVWAPRDGGATLYLAGSGGQLSRSEDLGDSWTAAGTFDATSTRAELAGSEAGAPRLWVVSQGSRIYRSDDAGSTWALKGAAGDYYGTLNASILDVDLFAFGGVDLYTTTNGGDSYYTVNSWWEYYYDPANLLHADIFGLDVELDADGEEVWYIGSDGGLYASTDGLDSVQNLSLRGLRVSQYYDTLTSSADPDHIAAGAQDQGYQLTNGLPQSDTVLDFAQALSGDYGHLTSADGSHAFVYSVYPGFILVQAGEEAPTLAYLDFPTGESYVPWLPPIVADPDEPKAFYFPATHLYRYDFKPISDTADVSLWSAQSFSSDGYEYLSNVTFSPLNADRVYASTSYGRFFVSLDHGLTWTLSPSLVPDENWYYGQATVASHLDEALVYVGGSGYGVPAVYRSRDGGASFEPWGQGLPDTLVYSLCEAPDDSGRLFAGTETSAYSRGPDDDAWQDITDNTAPITLYWSCEALTAENTIRFGTYGRGIWDYQLDPDHVGCYPVQDYDADGVDCTTDCDDGDPAISPLAAETCDGVDQNCDPDDLDEQDADGDGHAACAECDDSRAGVYPGAEEICSDGLDQDCSGEDLPCDPDSPTPTPSDTGAGGDKGGGCGCGAAGAGPGGALFALGLAVARRRRQR